MHTDEYIVRKSGMGYEVVRATFSGRVYPTAAPWFFLHSSAKAVAKAMNGAYWTGLMYPPSAKDSA